MRISIALALALSFAVPAQAASIVYNDRASWEAAVTRPIYTETFDALPDQEMDPAGGVIDLPLFDLVSSAHVHGTNGVVHSGANGLISSDLHSFPEIESDGFEFSQPLVAFGFDALYIEEPSGLRLTIGGETFIHRPLFDRWSTLPGTTFFGVISETPFSSVQIRPGGSAPRTYRLDNVSIAPIPEPRSVLLFTLGAAVVLAAVPFTARTRA